MSPEKRKEIILRILSAWAVFPDLRLGQFLVNVCGTRDIFYVPDEELVRLSEKFSETGKWPSAPDNI